MSQISRYSRSFAAVAAASLAGFALAACSPQLENPSTEKVDTALTQDADTVGVDADAETTGTETTAAETTGAETETTAAAAVSEVSFIDCVSVPAQEPEQVTLDCANPANAVTAITWSAWDEDEATGTGTNQTTGAVSEVVLSAAEETDEGMVFTTITVDGAEVVQ